MAGIQPQTQANPPPPNKWQCHVCHSGPYLYANTTRCTNVRSNNLPCNHDFCHALCKKDNDIPAPLTSAQSSPPDRHLARQAGSVLPPLLAGGPRKLGIRADLHSDGRVSVRQCGGGMLQSNVPSEPPQPRRSAIRNTDFQSGSRPHMGGWWKCGICGQMNNPAFNTGRCYYCAHPGPCRCCTKYR